MILVVLDHDGGKLRKSALEGITRARKLAESLGGEVAGLVVGPGAESAAEEARNYVSKVYLVSGPDWETYTAEKWAKAAHAAAQAAGARVVVAPASRTGRSWTARLAYKLDAALLEDTLDSWAEGEKVFATKYSFLNRVLEKQAAALPVVVSVKPNTTPLAEPAGAGAVENLSVELGELERKVEVLEKIVESGGKVSLTEADVVVTGGRGMGSAEAFGMIEEFADLLGGAVGATRAVIDAGWRPYSEQIGQTGKTVQPTIYFALALSGAVQHQAGMNKSKVVVAVNKDPDAPVFKEADYGVVGDIHQVLPAMIEEVKKLKSA
ncbi:electron transfer flavoprotein subunit alpha/FixB family protein [Oceanithermus sp.]